MPLRLSKAKARALAGSPSQARSSANPVPRKRTAGARSGRGGVSIPLYLAAPVFVFWLQDPPPSQNKWERFSPFTRWRMVCDWRDEIRARTVDAARRWWRCGDCTAEGWTPVVDLSAGDRRSREMAVAFGDGWASMPRWRSPLTPVRLVAEDRLTSEGHAHRWVHVPEPRVLRHGCERERFAKVLIRRHAARMCSDEWNRYGGAKGLVDALVHAGLVRDDSVPWFQGHYEDSPVGRAIDRRGTLVAIRYLPMTATDREKRGPWYAPSPVFKRDPGGFDNLPQLRTVKP